MPFPIKEMAPVPLNSFLERMFMRGAVHLYHNKAKSIGQQGGGGRGGWVEDNLFPAPCAPPLPRCTLLLNLKDTNQIYLLKAKDVNS